MHRLQARSTMTSTMLNTELTLKLEVHHSILACPTIPPWSTMDAHPVKVARCISWEATRHRMAARDIMASSTSSHRMLAERSTRRHFEEANSTEHLEAIATMAVKDEVQTRYSTRRWMTVHLSKMLTLILLSTETNPCSGCLEISLVCQLNKSQRHVRMVSASQMRTLPSMKRPRLRFNGILCLDKISTLEVVEQSRIAMTAPSIPGLLSTFVTSVPIRP